MDYPLILKWSHKRTGAIACWLGSAINKSNNNKNMVIYCPDDDDNSVFAMDEIDFLLRFEPYERESAT